MPDRALWRAYHAAKPSPRVLSLYYAGRLETGEVSTHEDWALLRETWTAARGFPVAEGVQAMGGVPAPAGTRSPACDRLSVGSAPWPTSSLPRSR